MIKRKAAGLAVAAAAAAAALSISVASPASAATSNGCTVTPLQPIFAGFNSSGVKLINYRISVSCSGSRTAFIEQQRFEEDGFLNPDDSLGSSSFTRPFTTSGAITISNVRTLVDTESGNEEVYHKVRFRVTSNGVTSPFTAFQKSAVLSIAN